MRAAHVCEKTITDPCTQDGSKLLATTGRVAVILATRDGNTLQTFRGHTVMDITNVCRLHIPPQGTIYCAHWSPDGQQIATGGADCTVNICHVASAAPLQRLSCDASVQALAWAPITQHLAIAAGASVSVVAPRGTGPHTTITTTKVRVACTCIALSMRAPQLASRALCLSWSADGAMLACGTLGGDVCIIDSRGVVVRTIMHTAPCWTAAWVVPSRCAWFLGVLP